MSTSQTSGDTDSQGSKGRREDGLQAQPFNIAAASRVRGAWSRPFGLVLFGVFWGLMGVFNLVISFTLFGPQDSFYLMVGVVTGTSQLVMQDIALRLVLQFLAVFEVITIYELVKGGSLSYYFGLGTATVNFLVYVALTILYYSAPLHVGLRTPLLIESLAVGAAFAALAWLYLRRPYVKRYLTRWT